MFSYSDNGVVIATETRGHINGYIRVTLGCRFHNTLLRQRSSTVSACPAKFVA